MTKELTHESDEGIVLQRESSDESSTVRKISPGTESLLKDFLDHNPTLSFIKDEQGRYLFGSKSFEDFFGVKARDYLGKTDFDWLPDLVARQFKENDDYIRDTGRSIEIIESVPRPEGVTHSLVNKFPIRTADGRTYIGGSAIDITRRTTAQELSAQLSSIVEFSHDAMIGLTIDRMISSWNRGAAEIFGYQAAEVVGKPLTMLIAPDQDKAIEVLKLNAVEKIDHYEVLGVTKSGARKHLSLTISPIHNTEGMIVGTAVIARDDSRRKLYENQIGELNEELRARIQQLETTNKELAVARDQALEASVLKSAFLANMSHELRTPLSAIIGVTELLLALQLDGEQKELAAITGESAQYLLELVQDILDLSRIESGRMSLAAEAFDISQLFEETIHILSSVTSTKNLPLHSFVDPILPSPLIGDPFRIKQVLMNLVGNAIKFTSEGGVTLSVIASDIDDNSAGVEIEVIDTGIGIAADEMHLLFQPFSQVDASASRKYGGTGLGLVITKAFVESMGGTISVSSVKGEGSTFTVHLRLARSNTPLPKVSHAGEQHQSTSLPVGKKVLVVEDSNVLRTIVVKQLKKMGIEAVAVGDGYEALKAVQQGSFDAILMDCQLPGLSGYDTTAAVRLLEKDSKTHVPIIATTASAMKGDEQKCLDAGMDDYLSKPVRPDDLLLKLRQWWT